MSIRKINCTSNAEPFVDSKGLHIRHQEGCWFTWRGFDQASKGACVRRRDALCGNAEKRCGYERWVPGKGLQPMELLSHKGVKVTLLRPQVSSLKRVVTKGHTWPQLSLSSYCPHAFCHPPLWRAKLVLVPYPWTSIMSFLYKDAEPQLCCYKNRKWTNTDRC